MALFDVPDIIISDLMMPEADGYEVCRTLKSDKRTSHVPIILLTAKATQDDKISGLQTGADAYLTKPFDKRELLVRLKKLLELRQNLQKKYQADSPKPTKASKAPSPDDLFFQKLRNLIEERIDDPDLSVHDLAKSVHLSRIQAYRKIKALTGKTPTLLIRSFRLQKGKVLLESTHLSISQVAIEVGFKGSQLFLQGVSGGIWGAAEFLPIVFTLFPSNSKSAMRKNGKKMRKMYKPKQNQEGTFATIASH